MATRRAPLELAQQAEKKGNFAKAVEAYLEHLKKNADDARALLRVAELEERLGQSATAGAHFRQLGALSLKQGFAAKAVSAARRASKLLPDDPESAAVLAEALAQDGKRREATDAFGQAAQIAAERNDKATRKRMLLRASEFDESPRASLALAELLASERQNDEAAALLRKVAERLGEQKALADQLRVLERLFELSHEDLRLGLQAAQLALDLREHMRSLLIVRRALDAHPDDARLIRCAAMGLEAYGETARAARVYRDSAHRFARQGDTAAAREAWLSVLRLIPDDRAAQAAIAPALLPNVGRMLERRPNLADIGLEELDDAVAGLGDFAQPPLTAESAAAPTVSPELDLESFAGLTIEVDKVPGEPIELEPIVEPAPAAPIARAAPSEPRQVRKALVLGQSPEAGWASAALADLGLDVQALADDALSSAFEVVRTTGRDLVVGPAWFVEPLLQEQPELVAVAPLSPDDAAARRTLSSRAVPVVPTLAVVDAKDLARAFATFGPTVELANAAGQRLKVTQAGGEAFQLAVATRKLGPSLVARPWLEERAFVVAAADGQRARALGEFVGATVEGRAAFVSSPRPGEQERSALVEQLLAALGLRGIGVVGLASTSGGWAFDGFAPGWGPGALAVEARLTGSLFGWAVELGRGLTLPELPAPRGAACALEVASAELASLSQLRVETGSDGRAFVCAHAAELEPALRRIARTLKRPDA